MKYVVDFNIRVQNISLYKILWNTNLTLILFTFQINFFKFQIADPHYFQY